MILRTGFRTTLFIGSLIGSLTLAAGVAQAWTGPTAAAPGNNTAAPINTSATSQTKSGNLIVNGILQSGSEIQSTSANAFRMVQGGYGAFFRNDGSNTYLLLTNSGDAYGSWNSLRPLAINNANGSVTVGTSLWANTICLNGSCLTGWPSTGLWSQNGTSVYYNGGNVGIGTSAPGDALDVNGTIRNVADTKDYGAYLAPWGIGEVGGTTSGDIYLEPSESGAVVIEDDGWKNNAQLCLNQQCISAWPSGAWSQSGSSVYYNGGNVGIGTNSPQSVLQVMNPTAGGASVLTIGRPTVTGNNNSTGEISLYGEYNGTVYNGSITQGSSNMFIDSNGGAGAVIFESPIETTVGKSISALDPSNAYSIDMYHNGTNGVLSSNHGTISFEDQGTYLADLSSNPSNWALEVNSGGTYGIHGQGSGYGVEGQTSGTAGVEGYNSGSGYGVYGQADGSGGIGVRGAGASDSWGGYFTGGYGVYGANSAGYYAELATGGYGLYTNGTVAAPTLCLNGDCRTAWPAAATTQTLQTVTNNGYSTSQPVISTAQMQSPIYYDSKNTGYYLQPSQTSRLGSAYFDTALIGWPGYNGITQAYGNYIWPGRNDGSGANWQQSWYLASNSSYGLYTNTGMYFAGTIYAPFMYDSNDGNYYLDPNGSSRVNTVYANGLYDESVGLWTSQLRLSQQLGGVTYYANTAQCPGSGLMNGEADTVSNQCVGGGDYSDCTETVTHNIYCRAILY